MKLARRCHVALILMVSGLVLLPGVSYAEPDLDVTMRMVTDDEALSDSVVQQIQLPDPAVESSPHSSNPESATNESQTRAGTGHERRGGEMDDRGRHLGDSLGNRARELRPDIDKTQPHKPDLPGKSGQ